MAIMVHKEDIEAIEKMISDQQFSDVDYMTAYADALRDVVIWLKGDGPRPDIRFSNLELPF